MEKSFAVGESVFLGLLICEWAYGSCESRVALMLSKVSLVILRAKPDTVSRRQYSYTSDRLKSSYAQTALKIHVRHVGLVLKEV